jgi:predicted RNA binding protein YcfA (HicA-like mRNA interferase family)
MTRRVPALKPQQVIRALERAGFEIDHQSGSHVVLRRVEDDRRVVVPWHNRDLGRGLTLQIVKAAGLTRDEFLDLLR